MYFKVVTIGISARWYFVNVMWFYSPSQQPVTQGAAETVLHLFQHQRHEVISVETVHLIKVCFTGTGTEIGLEKSSSVNTTLLVEGMPQED